MNTILLTFHSDAGHGWLEVTLQQITDAGLTPASFSAYSYRDRDKFYLEEDCDASRFLDKYKKNHSVTISEIVYDGECFIHNLPSIHAMTKSEKEYEAEKLAMLIYSFLK